MAPFNHVKPSLVYSIAVSLYSISKRINTKKCWTFPSASHSAWGRISGKSKKVNDATIKKQLRLH